MSVKKRKCLFLNSLSTGLEKVHSEIALVSTCLGRAHVILLTGLPMVSRKYSALSNTRTVLNKRTGVPISKIK